MINEQEEKAEIKEAIREINFLIQVMKDTNMSSPITKDLKNRFVNNLVKEEQNYVEYFNSTFYTDEEQKKIDDMIDCEIEAMKIERSEN